MKEIIEVELNARKVDLIKCQTDMLVVGMFSDVQKLDSLNPQLIEKLDGAFERFFNLGYLKAKEKTNAVVYGNDQVGAKRIMLIGLGDKKKATVDTIRKAAAIAAKKSVETKAETVSLALHIAFGGRFDLSVVGQVCAEGTYFGSYRYDEFVTENENGRLGSLNAELVDSDSNKIKKLKIWHQKCL